MCLRNGLEELRCKVEKFKDILEGEQQTKNVLIEPFLKLLGFDIANPLDIKTEYTCDFGTKKGEKVDYALFNGSNEPLMLVEAKDCKFKLNNTHISQLFRYFSVSSAKIALLTNGLDYLFFSDTNKANTMDEEPFYRFNVLNYTDEDLDMLSMFVKNSFNSEKIKNTATEKKFSYIFLQYLKNQAVSPSNEFSLFLLRVMGFTGMDSSKGKSLIQKEILNLLDKANLNYDNRGSYIFESKVAETKETTCSSTGNIGVSVTNFKTLPDMVYRINGMTLCGDYIEVLNWTDTVCTLLNYLSSLGYSSKDILALCGYVDSKKVSWVSENPEFNAKAKSVRKLENCDVYINVHGGMDTQLSRLKIIINNCDLISDCDIVLHMDCYEKPLKST